MGKIRLSIHPLFFLFGLYYAATGKIFIFLIFTLSALIHEIGHSMAAAGRGYKLNKITLMPYGAIVALETEMRSSDEIAVACAGPATNLAVAVFFVASWWMFPDAYPYTDVAYYANLGLCLINLLPAYPLDGGRIFYLLLKKLTKEKRAIRICKASGLILAAAFVALFFADLKAMNFTLLFFAAFMAAGAFSITGKNRYLKMLLSTPENLKRGTEITRVAFSSDASLLCALRKTGGEKLCEAEILSEDMSLLQIYDAAELNRLIQNYPLNTTFGQILDKNEYFSEKYADKV